MVWVAATLTVTVSCTTALCGGGVAREVDVFGANTRGSCGAGNDCCGVSDRFVSDGVGVSVGISKVDGNGAVHVIAEDEGGIAPGNDVDSAAVKGGGSIGNDCSVLRLVREQRCQYQKS